MLNFFLVNENIKAREVDTDDTTNNVTWVNGGYAVLDKHQNSAKKDLAEFAKHVEDFFKMKDSNQVVESEKASGNLFLSPNGIGIAFKDFFDELFDYCTEGNSRLSSYLITKMKFTRADIYEIGNGDVETIFWKGDKALKTGLRYSHEKGSVVVFEIYNGNESTSPSNLFIFI
jgi:hypothetical protein